MDIKWNQASTRRGAIGLIIFIVGIGLIVGGADHGAIEVLLLLGKGVSDYLKFSVGD